VASTILTKPVAPLSPPPAAVAGAAAIGATSGLKFPAPSPLALKSLEAQPEPWQDFVTGDFHEVLYTEKHQKVSPIPRPQHHLAHDNFCQFKQAVKIRVGAEP
jgi:hypothetical protein